MKRLQEASPAYLVYLAWMAMAVFLVSCLEDRYTGTEVGNPEITVMARLALIDGGDTLEMDAFHVKVMEAKCRTEDGNSFSFWNADTGIMVDMARPATSQNLPAKRIENRPWVHCDLDLALPRGADTVPDDATYEGMKGMLNWARWRDRGQGGSRRFFFYLPEDFRLRLSFGEKTMDPWHVGDSLFVTVAFDVASFAKALPPRELNLRRGPDGVNYYVLSPEENAGAHSAMLADFPSCFKADSWKTE